MSVETHSDDEAVHPSNALETLLAGLDPEPDRNRPNVSGDLPTVLQAAPMFRRAVVGYDRFQVDSYVRWAEDELLAADRVREHLVERQLRTRAELDEAQQLLAHSAGGGEMLGLSQRIGSMLAAAADEAAGIRTDAEAQRSAATAEANRKLGYARWRIAYAEARATRVVAEAAVRADRLTDAAARVLDDADRTRLAARAEAQARLAEAQATEQQAVAHAARLREQAVEEVSAARLQARAEIVRMLSAAHEERRRADAEAAASREHLARDAAARYASLLAEVDVLEHRRAVLRAEVELLAAAAAGPTGRRRNVHPSQFLGRFRWRSRSLRTP